MEIEETILSLAPQLSSRVQQLFESYAEVDDTLIRNLLSDEIIIKLPQQSISKPESICAVDGARVQQKMYAADLLLAVATAADGSSGTATRNHDSKVWGEILDGDTANSRIVETAMACLEISLLSDLSDYSVRILDGSFATPIFGIQEGIQSKSSKIRKKVYEILTSENLKPAESMKNIYTHSTDNPIIAIPKSDKSSEYVEELNEKYEKAIDLKDRFFAARILREKELLQPQQEKKFKHLELIPNQDTLVRDKKSLQKIEKSVRVLMERIERGELWFTYLKPANSKTVIKFEFFAPANLKEATEIGTQYASILNEETYAPHMLEPYPQVVVDKKAKKISPLVKALQSSIVSNLPEEEKERYGHLLLRDYRT